MGGIGPDAKAAVPALTAAFKDTDPDVSDVRYASAGALVRMGVQTQAAMKVLIDAAQQGEHQSAYDAIAAAGPAAKDAVPALIALIKDDNSPDRSGPAGALGGIGPDAKAAVPA